MIDPPLRRNHPRYPIHNIVTYHYQERSVLTFTLDLGLGGMKIKPHQHLPEGAHVNFKLLLAGKSIWPTGRIAYSRFLHDQYVVSGVQFMELSDEDHISLRNYLSAVEGWPKPQRMLSTGNRENAGAISSEPPSQKSNLNAPH